MNKVKVKITATEIVHHDQIVEFTQDEWNKISNDLDSKQTEDIIQLKLNFGGAIDSYLEEFTVEKV